MTVQRHFTHNSQKVKTTQISIIWLRDKWGIPIQKLFLINKKKPIQKTRWINLKKKKKGCKLCTTLYVKFLKRTSCSDRNKSPLLFRGQEQEGINCKGLYGNFYVIIECSFLWLYMIEHIWSTHKTVQFNLVNFIVWKLYLNKGV